MTTRTAPDPRAAVIPAGALTTSGSSGPCVIADNTDTTGADITMSVGRFVGGTAPSIKLQASWSAGTEDPDPDAATWDALVESAAITAPGTVSVNLPFKGYAHRNGVGRRYFRVSWVITGAPTRVDHGGIFVE